jgi:RNA polymerase sigma factor (sigma-70 family)
MTIDAEPEPRTPADVSVDVAPGLDISAIFAAQWTSLVRVALALVDDVATAEDVVQEAFAGLHRLQGSLADDLAAERYLRVSVVNGARSILRRRRTVRAFLRSHVPSAVPGADQAALLSAEQEIVRSALRNLPARQREVLTLRLVANLNDQEIAAATGLSHSNIRSAASRGLTRLRETFDQATKEA